MTELLGRNGYAAGWCVHYRYRDPTSEETSTCEAGVSYADFNKIDFDHRPCFLDKKTGQSKPNSVPCSHLRLPSPEEIKTYEKRVDAIWAKTMLVRKAIKPWREKNKDKDVVEIIKCPACGGRFHLINHADNNHVHGVCENADCVSWIE
jgi:hypothetical protein